MNQPVPQDLTSTPLRRLRGLGMQRSTELEKIGLKSVADVLYYLPRRYLDRTTIVKCRDLREGLKATVVGKISSTRTESPIARCFLCSEQHRAVDFCISVRQFFTVE